MVSPLGPRHRRSRLDLAIMVVIVVFFFVIAITLIPRPPQDVETNYCKQPEVAVPGTKYQNSSVFFDHDYAEYSQHVLSGAIKIPTESFDNMGQDPAKERRYDIFNKFHNYLEKTFPLALEHGNLEYINTYGVLYTFKGHKSVKQLRPVLLMSHQDVVPVNKDTEDQWDYPPFSGHFDGEWIYGRGASDTKNTLVGILEAVESLLQQGWKPERTLLVSFGFDEEIGGTRGAAHISSALEKRYGKDSIEVIVDEGVAGIRESYGALVATPAITEKGYVDIMIVLNTPGGHSSIPPAHTGIGIVADLVTLLEAHPFAPSLSDDSPVVGYYQCLAEHAPRVNKELKRTILDLGTADHRQRLEDLIESIKEQKYLIRTSQAIDIVSGGVKINALPDEVTLEANYRVAVDSSVESVIEHVEHLTLQIARKFNLSLLSRGQQLNVGEKGSFAMMPTKPWEPAPISPASGTIWNLIGGVTRHIYEEVIPGGEFEENSGAVVIAPYVMGANTDTRHYWGLTRSIYRFTPILAKHMLNFHTVNEKVHRNAHLATVAWYYEFIMQATEI